MTVLWVNCNNNNNNNNNTGYVCKNKSDTNISGSTRTNCK